MNFIKSGIAHQKRTLFSAINSIVMTE